MLLLFEVTVIFIFVKFQYNEMYNSYYMLTEFKHESTYVTHSLSKIRMLSSHNIPHAPYKSNNTFRAPEAAITLSFAL